MTSTPAPTFPHTFEAPRDRNESLLQESIRLLWERLSMPETADAQEVTQLIQSMGSVLMATTSVRYHRYVIPLLELALLESANLYSAVRMKNALSLAALAGTTATATEPVMELTRPEVDRLAVLLEYLQIPFGMLFDILEKNQQFDERSYIDFMGFLAMVLRWVYTTSVVPPGYFYSQDDWKRRVGGLIQMSTDEGVRKDLEASAEVLDEGCKNYRTARLQMTSEQAAALEAAFLGAMEMFEKVLTSLTQIVSEKEAEN